MYERMLNKQEVPTRNDMNVFCGDMAEAFMNLNIWLSEKGETNQKLTFPYGNNYGWRLHTEKVRN